MAVVTLQTLWLNVAADPTDSMSFPFMSALQVTTAREGQVRRYSAGRLRSIVQAGSTRQLSATLPACTREQIAWLEQRIATMLCARDDRGRKFWVVYFDLAVTEHQHNQEGDVTLTLSEVTHSEAV